MKADSDMTTCRTAMKVAKEHWLQRGWQTHAWEFLPPGLPPAPPVIPVPYELPADVKRRIKWRGYDGIAYPYPRLAYVADQPGLRDVELTTLENNRFRLVMANRLGPRIVEIHDKKLDVPLILPITSINSPLIGLTGAWMMGGLEFNAGRFGHTVFFDQKVPVESVRFADEDQGVRFTLFDELVNIRCTITIRLFDEQVAWQVKIENLLNVEQPFYWWTNIAVPAGEVTLLLYEPGPVINHAFDPGFERERWPVIRGHDASRCGAHTDLISAYFHRYCSDFFGFHEPRLGYAMVHAADTRIIKGRKLWSLSARDQGTAWWTRCYERGLESYCEIQAGLAPTQLEYIRLKARQTLEWTESVTGMPFEAASTYSQTWRRFARQVARMRLVQRAQPPHLWIDKSSRPLIRASFRQQSAERAVAVSQKANPTPDQIRNLCCDRNLNFGWRAGAAWGHVLCRAYRLNPESGWVVLQYAAGLAARKDYAEALKALAKIKTGPDPLPALACRLQAAILRARGQFLKAAVLMERALSSPSAEPLWWQETFEYYRLAGAIKPPQRLLKRCPASVKSLDIIRYEAAWLCFDQRQFEQAVKLLTAEMWDVGEGFFGAWALWREAWMAWGFELWLQGMMEEAMRKFYQACQAAYQFGIGRRETDDNDAPYFYRWQLAQEHGDHTMARALATQLLRRRPHPASDSAVYLLRIAQATGHASFQSRRTAIEAWRSAEKASCRTEPIWRVAMLDSLERGRPSPLWKRISTTDLWKYRAAFEHDHKARGSFNSLSKRRGRYGAGACLR